MTYFDTIRGRLAALQGGDEFVVQCVGARPGELTALAEEIVSEMRRPAAYDGHECRFGVSIGIAVEAAPEIAPSGS